MALPSIYEFSYTPNNGEETNFLLGTSVGGSLNFYLYNNFNDDSTDLSFKCKNYTLETTNVVTIKGILSCTIGTQATIECNVPTTYYNTGIQLKTTDDSTFTIGWKRYRESNQALLKATTLRLEAETVKIGTKGEFSSTGDYSWEHTSGSTKSLDGIVDTLSTLSEEISDLSDAIDDKTFKYHLTTLWIDVDSAFKLESTTGATIALACDYSKIMIMPAHAYLNFEPNHGGIDSLQKIITNSHLQYGSLCYLVQGNTHIMGVITTHSNGSLRYANHSTYGEVEGVSFTVTTTSGSSVSILAQDIKDRKYEKVRVN